ncbi:MAG: carboxypeptidase-like regulatory domain-containing protein [Crocinitomicaceae bacterium]|nr:carboxypeptidase-like regulatory domain-containing protein [Crocinitomicaceae bacterium]
MRNCILFLLLSTAAYSQNTQTISGKVLEQFTFQSIPYAKIEVVGTEFKTVADSTGHFQLLKVPIGRITVRASAEGYKPTYLNNLDLLTGKQLILSIELTQEITLLNEVTIEHPSDRQFSYNEMIQVSRRQFSIDESRRYAGTLNDIQRMASSFAGISIANDQVNDIIVRGNAPSGMLFRMDGMNIPNPNHWSMPGSSGGTVSMLNNNVLLNSDFLTGAFPAEFDAFSGVFDLKTRNGNYNKHEFLFQLGFNGLEAGAEGPIHRKSRTSYLMNYRLSFLELLAKVFDFGTGTSVPKYQDAFLKINIPTAKSGTFSFVATGGMSDIHFTPKDTDKNNYSFEDLRSGSNTGIVGITHQISHTSKYSFNTSLMASGVLSKTTIHTAWKDAATNELMTEPYLKNRFNDFKMELHHFTHIKLDRKNFFKVGFYVDYFNNYYVQDLYINKLPNTPKQWIKGIDYSGDYLQTNLFLNYLHKFNDNIELVTGLAYKYLTLTNRQVVEPKLSASFKTGTRGTVSFGTGLYSKAPSLVHVNLVDNQYANDGKLVSSTKNNTRLNYMKSAHAVAGYDFFITPKMHIKTELFYQYLFDVITARYATDSISSDNVYAAINEFSFSFESMPRQMANNGIGENYGIELTIEQFLSKGFYFLVTGSLFNSRYKAVDGKWRNTRFASNIVTNALIGKEFRIKPKFNLLLDLKFTYMNGNRYIPILEEQSLLQNDAVFDYANTYTHYLPYFLRLDFKIGFKFEGKKITQEAGFEAQNITNRKNVYMQQYNPNTNKIETLYQTGILPMGLYRIYF